MDWSDIRIFLAVARERTLIGAARKLGQSQPTMGRRLRVLENTVGHSLFQRTADGFMLTDEGTAMMGPAERMEEEALAIERQIVGSAQGLEGLLRITSFDWFGGLLIAPVLAEFVGQHPRVTVELLADPRYLSLSRREADLAFRIGAFDEPDVVSRRLMRIRYAVFGRKGMKNPAAGKGAGANLLTMDSAFSGTPDDSWLHNALPNGRIVFRSNSRDLQARLCQQGLGFAVLPLPLANTIAGLERFKLDGEPPAREVWIGYHRDLRRLARLRSLLDLVVERLAN